MSRGFDDVANGSLVPHSNQYINNGNWAMTNIKLMLHITNVRSVHALFV